MLIRTETGYANLATISDAELHDDGGVTLHWGKHVCRYAGSDAAALRQALEMLAGVADVPSPVVAAPEVREPARAVERREESAPSVLKFQSRESLFPQDAEVSPAPVNGTAEAELPLIENDEEEEPAKQESALSRRAHLVLKTEPIASLSHKQKTLFLSAVEKALDFNHLPPRFRRLLQDAEARRREELRQ